MIKIYHHPQCSKSRQALQLIREAGFEPEIILYVKQGVSRAELQDFLKKSALSAFDIVRENHALYSQYVARRTLSEEALLDLIVTYPQLLNRPLVISDKGAALCRPPQKVLDLLP